MAQDTHWSSGRLRPERLHPLAATLDIAARSVVAGGWVSRDKSREGHPPTVERVRELLDANPRQFNTWAATHPVSPESEELVRLTNDGLEALGDRPIAQLTDFEANLRSLYLAKYHTDRQTGLAAAAILTGVRAQEQAVRRSSLPPSAFVGQVGQRLRGVLVQVFHFSRHESDFGRRIRVVGRLPGGEQLGWWGPDHGQQIVPGATILCDGTVTAQVYDRSGQPLTELNRVAITNIANPSAPAP
jgi:hypothetical protein